MKAKKTAIAILAFFLVFGSGCMPAMVMMGAMHLPGGRGDHGTGGEGRVEAGVEQEASDSPGAMDPGIGPRGKSVERHSN
jgi:hypothetical protein